MMVVKSMPILLKDNAPGRNGGYLEFEGNRSFVGPSDPDRWRDLEKFSFGYSVFPGNYRTGFTDIETAKQAAIFALAGTDNPPEIVGIARLEKLKISAPDLSACVADWLRAGLPGTIGPAILHELVETNAPFDTGGVFADAVHRIGPDDQDMIVMENRIVTALVAALARQHISGVGEWVKTVHGFDWLSINVDLPKLEMRKNILSHIELKLLVLSDDPVMEKQLDEAVLGFIDAKHLNNHVDGFFVLESFEFQPRVFLDPDAGNDPFAGTYVLNPVIKNAKIADQHEAQDFNPADESLPVPE